jgi:hypothetical protein
LTEHKKQYGCLGFKVRKTGVRSQKPEARSQKEEGRKKKGRRKKEAFLLLNKLNELYKLNELFFWLLTSGF